MVSSEGGRPGSGPLRAAADRPTPGGAPGAMSPFTRLASAHTLSVAGDALVVVALADSLFFAVDPAAARSRVFLYLALTMAPFAVVAPLIGPALDRLAGARRATVVVASAARALVCLVLIGDLDHQMLFPLAFALLVLGKGYGVARSSLVPTVVRSDAELVEANSKLQVLTGLSGAAAAVPGVLAIVLAGSDAALVLAVIVFAAGALVATGIPPSAVSAVPEGAAERAELRGVGIVLAASAMGLIRAVVGFVTFLVAFDLLGADAPTWQFGVVLALAAVGGLLGAAAAPALRRCTSEERMVMLALGCVVVAALGAAWESGLAGAAALAAAVAVAATTGKVAFDSLVQRDAPDANRGRSFARFEARFQIAWVLGAAIPVALAIPARVGSLLIAAAAAFALVSYIAGQRAALRGRESRLRARRARQRARARRLGPTGPTGSAEG